MWGVSWVCLGRVKGINWTCYSLLSLSQEWTKMRNYRHKSDSISAQIYFTRYIGEEINQFIINFYVQIFQCILHNLYSHKKLKLNIQRSLLINICWGRVSQTRFMTFLITDKDFTSLRRMKDPAHKSQHYIKSHCAIKKNIKLCANLCNVSKWLLKCNR